MPNRTSTMLLAPALAAALLLAGCTGAAEESRGASASGPPSFHTGGHPWINVFDGEGRPAEQLQRVPLENAAYRYSGQTEAVDGWLFSYTDSGVAVTDYRTGAVPSSLPEPDYEGRSLSKGSTRLSRETAPVIADGYLYFADERIAGTVGDDVREIGRYDLATGRAEVLAAVGEFPVLAVDGGVLYYLADGALTALDASAGDDIVPGAAAADESAVATGAAVQQWRADSGAAVGDRTSIAVSGGVVAVSDAGVIELFDRADGTRLVVRRSGTEYGALTADAAGFLVTECRPGGAEGRDDVLDVLRLDARGEKEVLGTVPAPQAAYAGRPDAVEIMAEGQTVLVRSGGAVHALDAGGAGARWTAGLSGDTAADEGAPPFPPAELRTALAGGTAYVFASSHDPAVHGRDDGTPWGRHRLLAVDAGTGRVLARTDFEGDSAPLGPLVDGDSLLFLQGSGDDAEVLLLPRVN